MRRLIPAVIIVAGLASPALATGEIEQIMTPGDHARLDRHADTRQAALAEAREGGSEADVATLDAVTASALSFQDFDMTGDWRCRTIKAGASVPLVVYGWFRCRVTDDGSGWTLEKLSGSQRTKGRFFTDGDDRLIYLGTLALNDDPFPAYGASTQSDQSGYAFRTGEDAFRIEFPEPAFESQLDILELRR